MKVLIACFLALTAFAQSDKPTTEVLKFSEGIKKFTLVIMDPNSKPMVSVAEDGTVTFGDDYKPETAAIRFWEAVGMYAPREDTHAPNAVWIQDPGAGHYDCPDGWTAFSRSEPEVPSSGPFSAVYFAPPTDAKGHILNSRPPTPICRQDSK